MVAAAQTNLAEGPKELAIKFGAGDIAEQIHRLGNGFINEYLFTFRIDRRCVLSILTMFNARVLNLERQR